MPDEVDPSKIIAVLNQLRERASNNDELALNVLGFMDSFSSNLKSEVLSLKERIKNDSAELELQRIDEGKGYYEKLIARFGDDKKVMKLLKLPKNPDGNISDETYYHCYLVHTILVNKGKSFLEYIIEAFLNDLKLQFR